MRDYSIARFVEDLKVIVSKATMSNQKTVLIVSENSIADESMFDYINIILNYGKIPSIYTDEERDRIIGEVNNLGSIKKPRVD